MSNMTARRTFAAIVALLGLGTIHASAEQGPELRQIDTVSVFNRICYSKVPSLQAIRDMALELAWKPLDNDDLEAFGNKDNLVSLEGWDVQVGEKFYRVGISTAPVAESAKENFPGFENGVTTSCSMVLDGSDLNSQIATNMQTLAGKQPVSSDVSEGDLLTTTWAGGNDDIKVFLFNKATSDDNGGVLAVTVITKQ